MCVAERPSRASQADVIRLLCYTGCRFNEIRALRWQEVGVGRLVLCYAKTGPRTVHLSRTAQEIIERQPRTSSPYVFPSEDDPAKPASRAPSVWNLVRRRAGVEEVRLHGLRHSFASYAVMQGVPLPTVARLLGHRKVSMTLRYAHIADVEAEAAAERIGTAITALCDVDG